MMLRAQVMRPRADRIKQRPDAKMHGLLLSIFDLLGVTIPIR